MQKTFYILASVSGFLAVAIGAFGAHGLKTILEANQKADTFQTGVHYQFYHTFALFLTAILMNFFDNKLLNYAGYSFLLGIVLFSFSLYILALTNISKLGIITPFGGVAFMAGWCFVLFTVLKK